MSETEKPQRKPGQTCPLWRKDVSEVCHKCDWYSAIPMGVPSPDGRFSNVTERWGCALNHLLQVQRDLGTIADGTQHAMEDTRNKLVETVEGVCMSMVETVAELTGRPRTIRAVYPPLIEKGDS